MLNTGVEDSSLNPEVGQLVDRAVLGDAEAFGRLFDIYADRVYRHILYRTGNHEDARDMTQEVFASAWKALPKYRKTSVPFLGWLFTISHNRVIDYYRTRKDHSYLDTDMPLPASGPGPEELAEARFTQARIRRAILKLPPDQQRVIVMSFIENLSYSEIAAAINKSEGNVRVMVHRGLKKMREILNGEKD